MNNQIEMNLDEILEASPLLRQPPSGALSNQEKFLQFHELNPWVYVALVALTRSKTRQGYCVSIQWMVEELRYTYKRQTVDPNSNFRMAAHYASRYARLIMAQEPDLEGVFRLALIEVA